MYPNGISNPTKIISLLPSKHLAVEDLQSLLHKLLSAPQLHFPGALPINKKEYIIEHSYEPDGRKLLWLQDKCYNMLTKDSSCFILAEYELAHFIMKTFATKMAISKY